MITILLTMVFMIFILLFIACAELIFDAASGGIFILIIAAILIWRHWRKKEEQSHYDRQGS